MLYKLKMLQDDVVTISVELNFSSRTFHCGSGCSLAAVQLDLEIKYLTVNLLTVVSANSISIEHTHTIPYISSILDRCWINLRIRGKVTCCLQA